MASLNLSGVSERASIDASRANALRATVNWHIETISRLLLSSKENLDKRSQIESAFRACRDAFIEISTVLVNLLDERAINTNQVVNDIKREIDVALDDLKNHKHFKSWSECRGEAA